MKGQAALDAAHYLFSFRMHFPAGPRFLETEQADQPPLVEIVRVALAISVVPIHTGEPGLGDRTRAEPKVDREVVERFSLHGGPRGSSARMSPGRPARFTQLS